MNKKQRSADPTSDGTESSRIALVLKTFNCGFLYAKVTQWSRLFAKIWRFDPACSDRDSRIHTSKEKSFETGMKGMQGMNGDAFKTSWPCSLREVHGEAAHVQGGAEPESALVCLPALPLPEPKPERRPRKVDETALFFVCLRVTSWLPPSLFFRLSQPVGRRPGGRERLLWSLSPSSPLSLLILLVFLLPLAPAAFLCAPHDPVFLVML